MSTRIHRLWILWFVLLAVPGSRFLRFDGIPFTSKSEFFVVALSVIVLASPEARDEFRRSVNKSHGMNGQWISTLLVVTIFVKLLTFVSLPLGDGFEACYRSIYNPPKAEVTCEKSYDAPFLTNDDLNHLGDITRMETALNFESTIGYQFAGASATTWKLPFANDYPRLGSLWLDRLPFTAKFAAYVHAKKDSIIPVQYVGEIKISVNGDTYAGKSYESVTLTFIKVPAGVSELQIDYKFADLDSAEIPDVAPQARGPYATLFVGDLRQVDSKLPSLNLSVRGWAIDQDLVRTPRTIEIRSRTKRVLASAQTESRPDVATAFANDKYLLSGYNMQLSASPIDKTEYPLSIVAIFDDKHEREIGVVDAVTPMAVSQSTSSKHITAAGVDMITSFSLDQKQSKALVPSALKDPTAPQRSLLLIADFVILLVTLLLGWIAIYSLRGKLRSVSAILIWFFLCGWVSSLVNSKSWDLRNVLVSILVSSGIVFLLTRHKRLEIFGAVIGSVALSFSPILNLLHKYSGLGSAPWWNFPIWRGRDGDWFVTQGYARQIFVELSLRGGESLFYFQPGVRYLSFLQHLLLGDNDVLIAILMVISVLTAAVFVGKESISKSPLQLTSIAVSIFVVATFVIFSQFDFIGFAINIASEYPTWIFTILIFGFLARGQMTPRIAMVSAAIAGLIAQFRPNQVLGVFVLFILIQCELAPQERAHQLLLRVKLLIVFAITLSLSLFHNLYYAKTFALFSNTGQINSDISMSSLLNFFSDASVRNLVNHKIHAALYWSIHPPHWEIAIAFWSLQIMWLGAVILTFVTKSYRPKIVVALCLPLAYLLPLFPYRFESYYPRHIVIIQLAFGLSAIYILQSLKPSRFKWLRGIDDSEVRVLEND